MVACIVCRLVEVDTIYIGGLLWPAFVADAWSFCRLSTETRVADIVAIDEIDDRSRISSQRLVISSQRLVSYVLNISEEWMV